jgi:uncharacterized membrane protein YhfC
VAGLALPLVNAVLMVALAVAVAVAAVRGLRAPVSPLFVGAIAFVASQAVHIPLNVAVLPHLPDAGAPDRWITWVYVGLAAGVCEESARWASYRLNRDAARSWEGSIALGAGHGGTEAAIFGVLSLITVIGLAAYRDPAALAQLPPDQQAAVAAQVRGVFSGSPLALVGALERAGAICAHLGLSALVGWGFRRGRAWILVLAILWHALLDGAAVALLERAGVWGAESVGLANAVLALAVVWFTRDPPAPDPGRVEPVRLDRRPMTG